MFKIHPLMQEYWIENPKEFEAYYNYPLTQHKATMKEIQHVEQVTGGKLSLPYIEFVTQYGCLSIGFGSGINSSTSATFDYTISYADRIEVHKASVKYLKPTDKILTYYHNMTVPDEENLEYTPSYPADYLPIASSAGQDAILLKIKGDQLGSIWYWQFSDFAWGTEDNTWLGYVAKDFYEFINNLRPYE